MRLLACEERALASLTAWCRAQFGDRLVDLRLFGSRVRGASHEHSDVDVLIVVEALLAGEARDIGRYCGDLMTEHEVLLSPLALSADHWQTLLSRRRRIALDIEREGARL